ncbi:MAG: amidohydrolase family protein [Deltaproteobacteria bacterium]|nr:amidohydrolase family protein [Deltaproteobacteria bacterium]
MSDDQMGKPIDQYSLPRVIDCHTHAWMNEDLSLLRDRLMLMDQPLPDKHPLKWNLYHQGTPQGLLEHEKAAGIARFVLLAISAKPERCRELNFWVAGLARAYPEVIPFAALHPGADSIKDELDLIIKLGLKGVKLHSLVQRFPLLAPETLKLFEALEEARLPVMLDTLSMAKVFNYKPHLKPILGQFTEFGTEPIGTAEVARRFPKLTIIAAHMGALFAWEDLAPLMDLDNVYFDLSYTYHILSRNEVMDIIRKKGVSHILFGTDSPWKPANETLGWFFSLPLTPEEQEAIAWKNAERLLNI